MQVGLGPGHIVLDGDPAPPLPKGHSPPILAHVCCSQTAGWIKMPLGTEVGLGPGGIVLDGDPAPPPPTGHSPQFSVHVCYGQMVTHLSYCWALVSNKFTNTTSRHIFNFTFYPSVIILRKSGSAVPCAHRYYKVIFCIETWVAAIFRILVYRCLELCWHNVAEILWWLYLMPSCVVKEFT